MRPVDVGIFAHNEEAGIAASLGNALDQEILVDPAISVRIHVLANGCTDRTVARARALADSHPRGRLVTIHDFSEGGKSRTWNRFVHAVSRPEAEMLVFMDADIFMPRSDTLGRLIAFLDRSPQLAGTSSRPVKDITHDPRQARGPLDRLISAAGGTLNNWKTSICGQLYVLRGRTARAIHLPTGLPVEDGFLRALVQTRLFECEGGAETALDGDDDCFHVYASERSIPALIRHQTRIVIGSAINAAIYADLRARPRGTVAAHLAAVATDEGWLAELLHRRLPDRRYGYVPWSFLTRRLVTWWRSPDRFAPRRALVTAVGFAFDAVVYVRAQVAMLRGTGVGHW